MTSVRRLSFIALASVFVSLGAAWAEDAPSGATKDNNGGGCDRFAWSIAREKAWFDGKLTHAPSGERVTKSDEGVLLALKPTKGFDFFLKPERPAKPDSFSGNFVIAGVATPGLYQITLSDDAWIDVFQNGTRLKSTAFTGQKDCPGVRKSVRFDLTPGTPITIQISNSAKDSIKVGIAPAS